MSSSDDAVALLHRLERRRLVVAGQRALEAHHVVLDGRELLGIVEAVLLERGLASLQLRDGLDEPRLAIEHHELELGIAEANQRLILLHHVAGFDQHLLDAAAFDGIQIDSVARHDARAQRNEVVKGAASHGADGELVALDPQMALAIEQRGEQCIRGERQNDGAGGLRSATGATIAAEQGCPCC